MQPPPEPSPTSPARIVLYGFTSRWFLVAQGTGILSVILHQLDYQFHGLQIISYIFWVATMAMLFTMVPFYLLRVFTSPRKVLYTLSREMDELSCLNSITITFTSVIQMMALSLTSSWGRGWGMAAYVLWWINLSMAVLGTVIVPFVFIRLYEKDVPYLSPATRLPLIAALTAAAGGGTICQYAQVSPRLQVPVIIVSYLLIGMALPLAFALDVLVWPRMMQRPTRQHVYQDMILCGPWGQGSFALQGLGGAVQNSFAAYAAGTFLTAQAAVPVGFASIFAGLLAWGMGTFWWIFAILTVLHTAFDHRRWTGIPFGLPTWSLVFPWVSYPSFSFLALLSGPLWPRLATCSN